MKSRCVNCGAEMNAGAQFCEKCGRPAKADADKKTEITEELKELLIIYEKNINTGIIFLTVTGCIIGGIGVLFIPLINFKYIYYIIILLCLLGSIPAVYFLKIYYFPLRQTWRDIGISDKRFSKLYRQYKAGK